MRPKHSGFTLIELMIVVVLVAIIATIAVPGFTSMIEGNRFTATANNVIGLLNYARSEAVRKGEPVHVEANTGGWQQGIRVLLSDVAPGDLPNPLREGDKMPGTVTLSLESADVPRFTGSGKLAGFSTSEFKLCPGNGNPGIFIVVNGGGQTFRRETAASCP